MQANQFISENTDTFANSHADHGQHGNGGDTSPGRGNDGGGTDHGVGNQGHDDGNHYGFGAHCGSTPPPLPVSTVPEPSSWLLLVVSICAMLMFRQFRRVGR